MVNLSALFLCAVVLNFRVSDALLVRILIMEE